MHFHRGRCPQRVPLESPHTQRASPVEVERAGDAAVPRAIAGHA